MSALRRSSVSSETSLSGQADQGLQQTQQARTQQPHSNAAGGFRPLAPKPLLPSQPQTLAIRTATPQSSGTSSAKRRSPAACAVCYRIGCQLPTHTALASRSHSSNSNSPDKTPPKRDPAFTASYAYTIAQQHADPDITTRKADPLYNLPIGPEMNTPEMHRLFHSWFSAKAGDCFRTRRPSEIKGDLICSPFFLPATQDSLLCLSVLAAAAAARAKHSRQQAHTVTALTLLGQALQQMRERTNAELEHISDTTIVAAVFLWLVNIILEDIDTMITHSESIFAFVEARGGLRELGFTGAVAKFIQWVDAVQSFVLPVVCRYTDSPVVHQPSTAPPPRYGSYWEAATASYAIAIDPTIVAACQDSCRLLEWSEHAEDESLLGSEYIRLIDNINALFASGSTLRARTHGRGNINECICIAAAMIQFHSFCGLEKFTIIANTNVPRLANAIKATGGPRFWQQDLDLLIWLLFVVIMIPTNLDEASWCLPFLCRMMTTRFGHGGELDNDWIDDLRDCLQKFMWCDSKLEDLFRSACQSIKEEMQA